MSNEFFSVKSFWRIFSSRKKQKTINLINKYDTKVILIIPAFFFQKMHMKYIGKRRKIWRYIRTGYSKFGGRIWAKKNIRKNWFINLRNSLHKKLTFCTNNSRYQFLYLYSLKSLKRISIYNLLFRTQIENGRF